MRVPTSKSPAGILAAMPEVVVSASAGTALRLVSDQWVVGRSGRWEPVEEAPLHVLPLLERSPGEVMFELQRISGLEFPWSEVLRTALEMGSGYWAEQAVPWLAAVSVSPQGRLAQAARAACVRKSVAYLNRAPSPM
jgi:hypothetical protein